MLKEDCIEGLRCERRKLRCGSTEARRPQRTPHSAAACCSTRQRRQGPACTQERLVPATSKDSTPCSRRRRRRRPSPDWHGAPALEAGDPAVMPMSVLRRVL